MDILLTALMLAADINIDDLLFKARPFGVRVTAPQTYNVSRVGSTVLGTDLELNGLA